MNFGSDEMIFTIEELQCIANALTCSTAMDSNDMKEFALAFNLLNRINEQIDKIDYMQNVA